MKFVDLTGNKYEKLTVIEISYKEKGRYYWKCLCDCGNTRSVRGSSLKQGLTKSCGCLRKIKGNTKHGMSNTDVYSVWKSMLDRSTNPKNKNFDYYLGRSVGVSEEWFKFENFYRDMGERPEGHSIERIDNSLGYSKENCVWCDMSAQASNRRSLVNKSGRIGVSWHSKSNRWRASMRVKGKFVASKLFKEFKDACLYMDEVEMKYLGYVRSGALFYS